jgi:hypothetical protein
MNCYDILNPLIKSRPSFNKVNQGSGTIGYKPEKHSVFRKWKLNINHFWRLGGYWNRFMCLMSKK